MYGLEIIVDNTILDLFPKTSIAYEKLNPMFNEIGSHTLNFPIPWTDKNKLLFAFPNRLTTVFTAEKECICRHGKKILYQGTIIIKSSSDKAGNCFISMDEGDYYYLIKQLSMKDVNYGSDVTLGTTSQEVADYCTAVVPQAYPDVHFNFPIVCNPNFYGENNDSNPDYNGLMNGAWDVSLYAESFGINSINENPTKDNQYTLVPFLYLFFVISRILYHLNFKPLGTFWNDADLKKVLCYNNYPLDFVEKKYYVRVGKTVDQTIPEIAFPSALVWQDESTNLNEDNENCFYSGFYHCPLRGYYTITLYAIIENNTGSDVGLIGQVNWNGTAYATKQETIPANDIYVWRHSWTHYADDGEVGDVIYYQMMSLSSALTVRAGAFMTVNNNSFCALNQYSRTLNYSNHVPDKTVGEWIKEVENIFGFVSFVDNVRREHRMYSWNDLFTAELPEANDLTSKVLEGINIELEVYKTKQDFTFDNDAYADNNFIQYGQYENLGDFVSYSDLPETILPGKIARVLKTNKIYITKYDDVENTIVWSDFSDDFLALLLGNDIDQELDLTVNAAPMLTIEYLEYFGLMPRIKNVATSESFKTGTNDMPNRFMFYHGIDQNAYEKDYPMASSLKYGFSGDELGNFNLTQADLNTKYKSKYIEWLTSPHRKVNLPVNFTIDDVRNIKMWEQYKIGNAKGFIGAIKSVHNLDSFEVSSVEFYPI